MRIFAHNLLTDGLRSILEKQEPLRHTMHNLHKSIDRRHIQVNHAVPDCASDGDPGRVSPFEILERINIYNIISHFIDDAVLQFRLHYHAGLRAGG